MIFRDGGDFRALFGGKRRLCCDLCVLMGMLNVSIDMYENLKNDKKKKGN